MELWGVLWGSTVAIAEAGYSLLGGVVLFLMSLLLTGLPSINFTGNPEASFRRSEQQSQSEEVMPIAFAKELFAA
jgi:hypothetical protein